MPRNRPIPPEVLRRARDGDLESLRRLGVLIGSENATVEILDIALKFMNLSPVPIPPRPRGGPPLSSLEGFTAVICVPIFWQVVWTKNDSRTDIEAVLIKHLTESSDSVFGWTRVCIQNVFPVLPEDVTVPKSRPADPHRGACLSIARMLASLLGPEGGPQRVFGCSPAFADLLLEIWFAEHRRDKSGVLVHRMIENVLDIGCPIIELASKILSDDDSREMFLMRCSTSKQCNLFCLAMVDRLARGWEGNNISHFGWICSLNRVVTSVYHLWASHRFRRRFTRIGCLRQISFQLNAFSKAVFGKPGPHHTQAIILLVCTLVNLARVACDDGNCHAQIRRNWSHLHTGRFEEALFHATLALRDDEEGEHNFMHISAILNKLGSYMAYPMVFGSSELTEVLTMEPLHLPDAVERWALFLKAQRRAVIAFESLKTRPHIYFCDSLSCALSGKQLGGKPKQCSRCASVVYCSSACQQQDWELQHRSECPRARQFNAEQRVSHTSYDHKTRASQAVLLEVAYSAVSSYERYNSNTLFPILNCWFLDSFERDSYDLNIEDGIYRDEQFGPAYINPRVDTLLGLYRSCGVPPGWRLAECILPPIGNLPIHLVALLKPSEGGHKAVYCVPRYSYPNSCER